MIAFVAAVLTACSETHEEETEFANWQERNDAFFSTIYAKAVAESDNGNKSWKVIKDKDAGNYLEYSHILFSLNFFDRYADYFLTIQENHLHYILLDGINDFMLKYISGDTGHSVYELYCYSGGLLNTFLKWEEGGKKESPEEIAEVLFCLYNRS